MPLNDSLVDINSSGTAVGVTVTSGAGGGEPFVAMKGRKLPLSLVTMINGWAFSSVAAISDNGRILARGTSPVGPRVIILTPANVPLPLQH
jgi:hypothetical protein